MHTMQRKRPYQESLLRSIGHIHINEGHLGIVFCNGRFGYYLQPGWRPGLNRWTEELVAQIPVQMHAVDKVVGLRSSDGFDFELKLSVWFKFDPSKAKRAQQSKMTTIALSRNGDEQLKELVVREAIYSLRKEAGKYQAEQLTAGDVLTRLERQMRHHLQAVLMDSGIFTQIPSSVLLEMVSQPTAITEAQQKKYQRRQTMAMLRDDPVTVLQAQLLEMIAQQDNIYFMNGRYPANYMDQLFETAFAEMNDERRLTSISDWEEPIVRNSNGTVKTKKKVIG